MFGFLKRKKAEKPQNDYVALLGLAPQAYAEAMRDFFDSMDPATKAHVVVAYENLLPVLSACYSQARKEGGSFTVEDFIRELGPRLDSYTDEVNSRRMAWSLFAALLGRLEKLAREDIGIKEIGAGMHRRQAAKLLGIWCGLVREMPRLKALLPNNVVWKQQEKDWFDLSKSDEAMLEYGLNHTIPPVFAKTAPVEAMAKGLGIHYWPGNTRIGIIP